jgi:hypothetical protein
MCAVLQTVLLPANSFALTSAACVYNLAGPDSHHTLRNGLDAPGTSNALIS